MFARDTSSRDGQGFEDHVPVSNQLDTIQGHFCCPCPRYSYYYRRWHGPPKIRQGPHVAPRAALAMTDLGCLHRGVLTVCVLSVGRWPAVVWVEMTWLASNK